MRTFRVLAKVGFATAVATLLMTSVALAVVVTLHAPQRNTTSDCPPGSTVTWHFVLNQLDSGTGPLTLEAEFASAGTLSDIGTPVGNGQTQHFFIDTPTNDTLLDASVDAGTQSGTPGLVLSHIACGPPPPPSVSVDKGGDELSKAGDDVTYTFAIANTGGWPLTLVSVTDDVLGDLTATATAAGCDELPVGGSCNFSVVYTIQAGDPDPLVNTVTVEYAHADPATAGNVTDTDSHSTNLFQPSVTIDKGGPTEAEVGDTITYTFAISNTSSADSPNLILDSVTDTVLGDLTAAATAAGCDELASGAGCNFTADYTIPMGAPDPLVNVVTVHYHPDGFPNDITDTDDHSVIVRGNEGCTPGFWKNHLGAWTASGLAPSDSYDTTFGVTNSLGASLTLQQAINTGGGGERALLRHSVAALLNAASPDVDYAYTTAEVIAIVQNAYATGDFGTAAALLAAANEAGCPL